MILHLTAGRGPAECRLAVERLVPLVLGEAERAGLAAACLEDRGGSALLLIEGETAEAFCAGWSGSVLWRCPSPLRPGHRRKNWFVRIAAHPLAAALPDGIAPGDLAWDTFRAAGPGGQHVNRTESAVRVRHRPSGLVVACREGRSQHRNRALALVKLRIALAARQDEIAKAATEALWHDSVAGGERGTDAAIRIYEGPGFRRLR
ncbi:peptide chain release factor-like protein [Methylobacterium oryzisoli]|uniref:peptide chain release factor-like protein n=1 Tax=Methylobacterium oryzisoli TaxID=3385502 RepID=UPI003892A4D4